MNFSQLKQRVRERVFPSGEARSLAASHNASIVDALVDVQTWVECLQQDNTQIIPHCNTLYNCGLTVLEIPRGRIKRLIVIDKEEVESETDGNNIQPGVQKTLYADNLDFGVADIGKTNTTTFTIKCAPNTKVKGLFASGGVGTAFTATSAVTLTPIDGTEGDAVTVNPTRGAAEAMLYLSVGASGGTYRVQIVQTITAIAGELGQRIQNGSYVATSLSYFPPATSAKSTAPDDWCGAIDYLQVDPCVIQRYLQRSKQCGSCLPLDLYFAIPEEMCGCKGIGPVPTDEGVPAGLPKLPLGYHYPQESTDATMRATHGIWAIERGKIFIAPWINSTETVVIYWDGIKRQWDDADLVDDDPKLMRAVEFYLRKDTAAKHGDIIGDPAEFERQYNLALADLIHECREETRVRDCEPSHARGSQTSITSMYFNDRQQYTATCPSGQTGDPVTVTIPAETVGSIISKADANQKALAEAKAQAEAQLDCSEPQVTYWNEEVSFTAECQVQDPDAPVPTGDAVTVVIPAHTFSSTNSQDAADVLAEAEAEEQAYRQLTCTFYNKTQSYTASCEVGVGADVTVDVAAGEHEKTVEHASLSAQAAAQQMVNDEALTDATNQAKESLECSEPDEMFWNQAKSAQVVRPCNLPWAGGAGTYIITYTVPANSVMSLNDNGAGANSQAQNIANNRANYYAQALCQNRFPVGSYSFTYPQ